MTRAGMVATTAGLAGLLAAAPAAGQEPAAPRDTTLRQGGPGFFRPGQAGRVRVFVRFSGTVPGPDGEPLYRVVVRDWIVEGDQRLEIAPQDGETVLELRGGDLTIVLEDERNVRREGEIWTLPPGTAVTLETEDDAAALRTRLAIPLRR